MAYTTIPPSSSGGGSSPLVGPKGIYQDRALSFLGLTATDPTAGDEWYDFTGASGGNLIPGFVFSGVGTGSGSYAVTNGGGGVFRALTGATANSQSLWLRSIGLVSNVTTAKWYIAWRFRIPTTPDAQTRCLCGLIDSATSKSICGGFAGSLSATNFVVQYDGGLTAGSAIDLGVAVNTSFHVIELYGLGTTTVRARFDGGSEVTAVMGAASANFYYPLFIAFNGTTAADQRIEPDYYYAMFQRI